MSASFPVRRRDGPGDRPLATTRGDQPRSLSIFSLVASGQITLRRIDGWRKIAAVLSQDTRMAA